MFSGVVGTSGGRKEFSVLGDVVNVAARIMGKSKYDKGKIYVDFQTKCDAESFISFRYIDHFEFKGKSVSLPVYEPIPIQAHDLVYQNEALKKPHCTSVDPKLILKLHSNPFLID